MSLVLATDYRVRDFDAWWGKISTEVEALARLSAHFVVVYRSLDDAQRIFVTVGVAEQRRLDVFMRSPNMFEWFDSAGVDDLPPIFVGRVVEKIDLREPATVTADRTGVVVASIAPVESVERLQQAVEANLDRMRAAGVRRYWLYQAVDNATEVLALREITTEERARRWLHSHDVDAQLMAGAGVPVYPPPFVGTLVAAIDLTETPRSG
jgi:hypothetical protein